MATALTIKVEPIGPNQQALADAATRLEQHLVARAGEKGGAAPRLLGLELVDSARDPDPAPSSPGLRAVYYDYEANQALRVESGPEGSDAVVTETAAQPVPSPGEFADAVEILTQDAQLGAAVRGKRLRPYRPMPPLIPADLPDGRQERTLGVGLLPTGTGNGERHEIVGVNMIQRRVERFPDGAPATSRAAEAPCGVPGADQLTANRGDAGRVRVTVLQGSTELWRFIAIRPAASSGDSGSGVELRQVHYRGRRVLFQAHVPILNVKYDDDACGPFRDWQWQEGMIQATGRRVAPGFMLASSPAKTILQTRTDQGNFLGVGVYVQGQEAVLVSEMEAGWYRYVSEWRFHADGTMRPRFGFDAVDSSCVCARHHHHVYWRLDFSIEEAADHLVKEFNDPAVQAGGNWHTLQFETRRLRDAARKRRWRVENSRTGRGYAIVPGSNDGTAKGDSYAKGDLWVLRWRPGQIDDEPLPDGHTEILIDKFKNRESIVNQDLVVWYGAHFSHDVHAEEEPGHAGHIVGPDLKPHNW
jgi:hypothetical protein